MKSRPWAAVLVTLLIAMAVATWYKPTQWFFPATLLSLGAGIYLHKKIRVREAQAKAAMEDASLMGLIIRFIGMTMTVSFIDCYVWQKGWWAALSIIGNIGVLLFGVYASKKCDDEAERVFGLRTA